MTERLSRRTMLKGLGTAIALAMGERMMTIPARMLMMPIKSFQPQAVWSINIPIRTKMP